jgi:hypothetical protein
MLLKSLLIVAMMAAVGGGVVRGLLASLEVRGGQGVSTKPDCYSCVETLA